MAEGADSGESIEAQAAVLVLREIGAARQSMLRALALMKKHPEALSPQRTAAIIDLCNAMHASLDDVRELAGTSHPDLSDAALKAFLEESENS